MVALRAQNVNRLVAPTGQEFTVLKEYVSQSRVAITKSLDENTRCVWKFPIENNLESYQTLELEKVAMKALAQVAGVMPVLSSYETSNGFWIQMPYLGKALIDYRPSARFAAAIAPSLTATVRDCEQLGWWHQDIKPENLFFSKGSAVVGDFGVAVKTGTMPPPGIFIGTPEYASPERMRGYPVSDDYEVGAALYWLATGCCPVPLASRHSDDITLRYRLAMQKKFKPWGFSAQMAKKYSPFTNLVDKLLEPLPQNRISLTEAVNQFAAFNSTLPPYSGRFAK